MRNSSYTQLQLKASVDSPACRRCGHAEFTREIARPPHFQLERCGSCGLFARFIPKPKTHEQVGLPLVPRDDSHKSCAERFEKLEKTIAGHDRQLLLFTKIILSLGTLQGKQRPEIHIADELVSDFCKKLYESENGDGSVREY